jgi:hypothetical protein
MKSPADSMRPLSGLCLFTLMCFLLSGCTVLTKDIGCPVDPCGIRFIEGETHYRTVIHQLGPPAKVSSLTGGLAFLYEHVVTKEKQIGLSIKELDETVFRWLKFSTARGRADRQDLLLVFDEKGILRNQRFKDYDESLGSGSSIQFKFAVETLVDSSFLEDSIGPNQWGTSLLRPLPQTLNVRQSLETGDCGLEQAGTPTSVGQHTLELRR